MTMPMLDGMQDVIEKHFQTMILTIEAEASPVDSLKVMYRGEPGIVPAKLYPFAVVYVGRTREMSGGVEGYGPSTAERFWRHEGYLAFEVLFRDTTTLMPDSERRATVGSYEAAKELAKAALVRMKRWDLDEDAKVVIEPSGAAHRTTGELFFDEIENAMTQRTADTAANRAQVSFHMYSQEDMTQGGD